MFLTVTGGEWLLPLLVFLAMLGIAEYCLCSFDWLVDYLLDFVFCNTKRSVSF